jgi:hypothetical protein
MTTPPGDVLLITRSVRPPPRWIVRLTAWKHGPGAYAFGRLTGRKCALLHGLRSAAERALRRGKLDKASRLARELVDLVLQYFDLCAAFWKYDLQGSLPAWAAEVRERQIPDLRANLLY